MFTVKPKDQSNVLAKMIDFGRAMGKLVIILEVSVKNNDVNVVIRYPTNTNSTHYR